MFPGDHASTFGGNPLATAAGNVVIDELLGGLLDNVREQGTYLEKRLDELAAKYSFIKERRGVGLMQGIELDRPVADYIAKAIDSGLLLVNAGQNVIRFVPSLIVEKKHIDNAVEILDKIM